MTVSAQKLQAWTHTQTGSLAVQPSCGGPHLVPSLPALGLWAPPAERGPSLASVYRVSLTVDVGEGQSRKLAAFIAPLSATIPAQHKNSPLL